MSAEPADLETPTRIGFIGLGAMGGPMAAWLIRQGWPVTGYDVAARRLADFQKAGGVVAPSASACAHGKDLLILVVTNADQAAEVLFGVVEGERRGVVHALAEGATVVLCSTVPPAFAEATGERLEARGLHFLDAPISGGCLRAADGTLSMMASGSPQALARARPVCEALTEHFYVVGDQPGLGSKIKMINQLLAGSHIALAAEALAFGKHLGLDTRMLFEIIANSAGSSWMFQNRGPRMLESAFDPPQSAIDIFVKDLTIVQEAGESAQFPLPISNQARALFLQRSAAGDGRLDDAAVIKAYPGIAE